MVMINIQKKDLFLMLAIVVFMTGVGIVISYNPSGTGGTPSVMGHSIDEISLPACTDGQILKKSGSSWICSNINVGADIYTNGCVLMDSCKEGWVDKGKIGILVWLNKINPHDYTPCREIAGSDGVSYAGLVYQQYTWCFPNLCCR